MAFSSALTLTDLNDFITPSQACIKPVEQVQNVEDAPEAGAAATEIRVDASGTYYEVGTTQTDSTSTGKKLSPAQISLNDCLACSGCITSAESVLITMQSHEEVLSFLSSNSPPTSPTHRLPILSISPQSLASLAAATSSTSSQPVSLQSILNRVRSFCHKELGFAHVFDTTFARHISLLEQCREFKERKTVIKGDDLKLPMLASSCPGWICYAEKTHAEMLPFISRTKSPQQIMGSLVKEWLAKKWGKRPDQIYHVSVMPCYDKKLEASRQDFYNDIYQTRDVDCVITTGELELLMNQRGWDLSTRVDGESTSHPADGFTVPDLVAHPGSSSGSYLQSIISFVSNLPENQTRPIKLTTRQIRSSDYEEFLLEDTETGEIIFKGAKCYGFKNLQNIVRKVAKENSVSAIPGSAVRPRVRRKGPQGQTGQRDKGYDFVEVMACPSGCVNGGGQLRPVRKPLEDLTGLDAEGYPRQWENEGVRMDGEDTTLSSGMADPSANWGNKDWIHKVETAYWFMTDQAHRKSCIEADMLAVRLLQDVCLPQPLKSNGCQQWMMTMDPDAEKIRTETFRTNYRKVESGVVGIAVQW